jgi:hypothetical protein
MQFDIDFIRVRSRGKNVETVDEDHAGRDTKALGGDIEKVAFQRPRRDLRVFVIDNPEAHAAICRNPSVLSAFARTPEFF